MIYSSDASHGDSLDSDPRWQAVQRVVASRSFSKAARLSTFLIYVADRALRGREDEITEQQVGVHVFGRPTDYNPGDDNIVRGSARQLRQRLALFYQEEGQGETIRIEVPRGGYVPVFETIAADAPRLAPAEVRDEPVKRPAGTAHIWRIWKLAVLGAMLFTLGGWFALRTRPPASDKLWRSLFAKDHETFLVPGDSGFVMFQNLTGKSVHIADYASGSYRLGLSETKAIDPATVENIGTRRYTSISDLKFAARLARLPQVVPDRFEIRYARDLRIDDLKKANAVIVGAPQGNPWVELFDKDLNFHIDSDEVARTLTVVNKMPLPGEPKGYTYWIQDPNHRAFATVALTSNLDKTGRVLIVEGTTMAGIDAGADFLFNDALLGPVVQEATNPDGSLKKFEVVLETRNIASNGLSVQVVAKRFRPF